MGIEIEPCLVDITFALNNVKAWMQPVFTPSPALLAPSTSEYRYEPYGVCLIIGPFNYPLDLLVRAIIIYFYLF